MVNENMFHTQNRVNVPMRREGESNCMIYLIKKNKNIKL